MPKAPGATTMPTTSSSGTRNGITNRQSPSRQEKSRARNGNRKTENLSSIEQRKTEDSHENPERLQQILENLNLKFTNCTFTYKPYHLKFSATEGAKKKSKLSSIGRSIRNTLVRVREAVSCEHNFERCLYVPTSGEYDVKNYVQKNLSDIQLSFIQCRFIQRSSTVTEQIRRRLRKVFGIQFELAYITATVDVEGYKFRLKDISAISQQLQERIAQEG